MMSFKVLQASSDKQSVDLEIKDLSVVNGK